MPASEVLRAFGALGVTSFGGPIAHLGYFREAFVTRRRWLREEEYADLVGLAQFLPGPASSQVGAAIGALRAGWAGALAAWIGFTLPSALLLMGLAIWAGDGSDRIPEPVITGLLIVAVAVVAQAVWGMGKSFCRSPFGLAIAIAAGAAVLVARTSWVQVAVIAAAGLAGYVAGMRRAGDRSDGNPATDGGLATDGSPATDGSLATDGSPGGRPVLMSPWGMRTGSVLLLAFAGLLVLLPLAHRLFPEVGWVAVADSFYTSGALVFGGGHVVLPLLESEVVPQWVTEQQFLAGYGAAQAVPGPLFTFAAYLGAISAGDPSGLLGGLLALVAIFLPGLLLMLGALPFWHRISAEPRARTVMGAVNAAVVGILAAALWDPLITSGIRSVADAVIAGLLLVALMRWRLPAWAAVLVGVGLSVALSAVS